MNEIIDVGIIGAGPAGLSAALAARQAGFRVILFEKSMPGGKLNSYQTLEHFPGYEHLSAQAFGMELYESVSTSGTEIVYGEVVEIKKINDYFVLQLDGSSFQVQFVIVATGTREKPLTIPGASLFLGQGISYCAACDGGFFKNKEVVVIGGDTHAIEEAIFLANLAHHVTLLVPYGFGQGQPLAFTKLKQLGNVSIINEVTPVEIFGQEVVQGLRYQTPTSGEVELLCDGIFPVLGWIPNQQCLSHFPEVLDTQGFGVANAEGVSAVPGLYLIGDLHGKATRRIKNIISQGQLVIRHLQHNRKP